MSGIIKNIRAVFLDLDETLVDDDRCMREAVTRTCQSFAERHSQIEPGQLESVYMRVAEEWWLNTGSVPRTSGSGSTSGIDIRIEVWGKALTAYGLSNQDLAVEVADTYTRERSAGYCLFPEVAEVLGALHRKFTLGVISNGPGSTQLEKFRVTGLAPFMDVVAISGELGIGKPDPGIFLKALELARVKPEEAVHVGDSLTSDVAGARGVGMCAVWINRTKLARPQDAPIPDFEIETLRELVPLLVPV
jgi:putative hydrolase of the HAD superfamily